MERKANIFEAAYYVVEDCLKNEFGGKLQPSIALERTFLPICINEPNEREPKQLFLLKPIQAEICDLPLKWGMLSYSAKPEDAIGSIFHYPFNDTEKIEIGCGLMGAHDKISFIYASINEKVLIRQRFPFSYRNASESIDLLYEKDSFCAELSGNRQNILDIACVLTDIVNCVLLFPDDT